MSFTLAALCLLQAVIVKAEWPSFVAHAEKAVAPAGCSKFSQSSCPKLSKIVAFISRAKIDITLAIAANLISSCEAATVSWDYLTGSKQASCLCYSGGSWAPNNFDGAVLSCANYASTADPTDYPSIAALEQFCTKQGDVVGGGGATATAKTTPAPTATSTNGASTTPKPTTAASGTAVTTGPITACATVDAAITSCESATPGWTDLAGTQQASCICYSGSSWAPNAFDDPVLSCANYLKTASPSDYSDVLSIENFCTKKGDVRASTGASTKPSGTGSVVVVPTNPATPSLKTSSSTTSASTTPNVVVVTATPAASTTAAKSGGTSFSRGLEGTVVYLGVSLALAALGMCILL